MACEDMLIERAEAARGELKAVYQALDKAVSLANCVDAMAGGICGFEPSAESVSALQTVPTSVIDKLAYEAARVNSAIDRATRSVERISKAFGV